MLLTTKHSDEDIEENTHIFYDKKQCMCVWCAYSSIRKSDLKRHIKRKHINSSNIKTMSNH